MRDLIGGGKKNSDEGPQSKAASQPAAKPAPKRGRGRLCMYGHVVPRGKKMCEHRHWVG